MIIRNIFFYVAFLPTTIVLSALTVLAFWDRSGRIPHMIGYIWGSLTLFYSGIRVEADLSAMDRKQNYIFFANHQSMMDIPIIYRLIGGRRRFGFVAKQSLFKIPLFGQAMLRAGHVPIDRENPRKALKSIDFAIERISRGTSVVLFPEGTRSTDWNELKDFQIGGMIMALKCGVPVVPLVVFGSGPTLPKGSKTIRPRRVRIKALAPVETSNYDLKQREQFKKDMYEIMNSAYRDMAARERA
jgi:1-acyl-sn-glycerol-3-phosphate acyltransferase